MAAVPPYSTIRRAGDLLVTAGILGRRDDGLVDGFAGQLRQAFDNLEALLAENDVDQSQVIRLVVYLTDIDDMGVLNEIFSARFTEPRPARSTVAVVALPGTAAVEIEATVAV